MTDDPSVVAPPKPPSAIMPTETPPETPPPEAPPTETPPAPPQGGRLTAEEFQALAKVEYEKQQLKQQLKQQADELDALKNSKKSWSEDPLAAFQEHGGNVQHLADRFLNDNKPSQDETLSKLEKELEEQKAWRAKMEEQQKRTTEQQKHDQYLTQHAAELQTHFQGEEYQPVNQFLALSKAITGQDYDLKSYIDGKQRAMYEQSGKALTPAEMAATILEEAKVLMTNVTGLDFWGGGPAQSAQDTQTTPPASTQTPAATRTPLTSGLESGSQTPTDLSKLSRQERIMRAAKVAEAMEAERNRQ